MPNIIDNTYFQKGNLYIPNNRDITVDTDTAITEIEDMVTKYERELLLNTLGVVLYNELQVALVDLPSADLKWRNLVDGTTYVNSSGKTKIWDGLKGYNKQSLIAFFVFTEYLRNDSEVYTTTGVVRNVPKNAEIVNPTPKFIKAYSQFIKAYQGDVFCQPKAVVNDFGSVGLDWRSDSVQVSLLGYLSDSNDLDATSFPDIEFKFYNEINTFGI